MKRRRFLLAAVVCAALSGMPAAAQQQPAQPEQPEQASAPAGTDRTAELERRIELLQRGQDEILRQLGELRRWLQSRSLAGAPAAPAAPNVAGVVLDLADNPVKGAATARLTLIDITDYQCPYCARHFRDTAPQIEEAFIATGKIRFAALDMPLESIHPLAFKAALASHCAEDQGKYWEMHDLLFAQQRALEPFSAHALALGLDVQSFEACLSTEKHAAAVRRDIAEAAKSGATGTPSFLLAAADPQDPTRVTGISFIRGAQPFAVFSAEIEKALATLAP